MIVFSNTTPFIALASIDQLDLCAQLIERLIRQCGESETDLI
ncbi:MAG: hypothetical protein Q3M30_11725 [Candidatus Electrothrix sp. Rat3]|nr:hypothetical protein [Candidatus Electrothrix rattekaaiensis]